MKTRHMVAASIGAWALSASPAFAELWNPLDTVPKPNVVTGIDTSVTMGITPSCGSCHGPGNPNTRLNVAKGELLQTLPLFRDYFVFGGFQYSGCGYAKINQRVLPNPADPNASYAALTSMISGVGHCGSRENYFPGGGATTSGCITPSSGCEDDVPIIEAIVSGALPGFTPTLPNPLNVNVNVPCTAPGAPQPFFNLQVQLLSALGGGSFSWPRWNGSPTGGQVISDFCSPLLSALLNVRTQLNACLLTPTIIWDMSFLDTGWGGWCTPGTIAGSACTGVFAGTCVCDSSIPGCSALPIPNTECNNIMTWKARQQVAVCEAYSNAGPNRFGTYFRSQPDNRVNAGGCRENVAIFLTDGYQGHRPGVLLESSDGIPTYQSVSGLSNMFVFHISSEFNGDANRMMEYVSGGNTLTAYDATNAPLMQESFAKVLSRIYKGVYTGASMATDTYQTRAVFHAFTVPGYAASGPVTDTYLGFPSRLSVYPIGANGTIATNPLYETDWASKVSGAPGCGPFSVNVGPGDIPRFGPGGTFRNGVSRTVNIPANSTDRTGDGTADPHPALTYGRAFSFAATKPIVIEGPREAPPNGNPLAYVSHQLATRTRPRMYAVTAGPYVIVYHGGIPGGSGVSGGQSLAFTYDDSVAAAGREMLRFKPNWVTDLPPVTKYDYRLNDLVQQHLISGELVAREVWVRVGGVDQYRTVIVGGQGKDGPGYFAVDVTDPCTAPSFTSSWRLPPGDFASAEPAIYTFPMSAAPQQRTVLVTTGGLEGSSNIYAYDIVTGGLLAQSALPGAAGRSYAVQPVCVDVKGEGFITHCYALRDDGLLARIEVRLDGFGPWQDATPIVGGVRPTMTGNKRYYSAPVAFFGNDGAVNLFFGSGEFRNLTQASVPNQVFKVVDDKTRQATISGPASLQTSCAPSGGVTSGVLALGPNERVLSKPIIDTGVVAFTTYESTTNGCVAGMSRLYAMNFDTCADAIGTGARPVAQPVGAGIPTAPVLHRRSGKLLVATSAGPTAAQVTEDVSRPRGGVTPYSKRVYWRLELDNP